MEHVAEFCPAKLNLFLAVTHRRDDGFHELVSVAAPVDFGDRLLAEVTDESGFTLTCDDAAVPTDGSNLVLRAAELFRERTGWSRGVAFRLEKVTPMGAGLGGGSSDAVGALRALNRLAGDMLTAAQLTELSAELGSDCPLFFASGPVVMRGRGERISLLPETAANRLRARDLLVVKPSFGINTAWAYGRLAESAPRHYLPSVEAEARIQGWIEGSESPEALGFNSFESVIGAKHVALPTLAGELQKKFNRTLHLSGSGSACFLWPQDTGEATALVAWVRSAWGPSTWVHSAKITTGYHKS